MGFFDDHSMDTNNGFFTEYDDITAAGNMGYGYSKPHDTDSDNIKNFKAASDKYMAAEDFVRDHNNGNISGPIQDRQGLFNDKVDAYSKLSRKERTELGDEKADDLRYTDNWMKRAEKIRSKHFDYPDRSKDALKQHEENVKTFGSKHIQDEDNKSDAAKAVREAIGKKEDEQHIADQIDKFDHNDSSKTVTTESYSFFGGGSARNFFG